MHNDPERDADAIAAIGNGRALAYVSGPSIRTMYAPHYSTASVLRTEWPDGQPWSEEISPRASWKFGVPGLQVTMFAEADHPAITHRFEGHGRGPAILADPSGGDSVRQGGPSRGWSVSSSADAVTVAIAEIPRGRHIFVYPAAMPRLAAVTGSGIAFRLGADATRIEVELVDPSGWFSVIGADDLEQLDGIVADLHAGEIGAREASALQSRRERNRLPEDSGLTSDLRSVFEQATDQLIAQQSVEGGFIAGDRYPLSYLRDQYGTCAGLLAVGHTASVERALRFRLRSWRQFGDLANAESMGNETVRHFHENDDVEQTGYIVLSVLELAEVTDPEVIDEFAELIAWCLHRQHLHLVEGALPFNGDETYIAGGMLPRWAIEDGSLEATILYAECLRRMGPHAAVLEPFGIDEDWLRQELGVISSSFEKNFVRGDVLVSNSTRRRASGSRPYRTGVCELCGHFPLRLRRTAARRYLCPTCLPVQLDSPPEEELFVPSAALMAITAGSPLIDPLLARATTVAAVSYVADAVQGGSLTGYDEGLLARALRQSGMPAEATRAGILDRRDRYGTWAEYYRGGGPTGARCRPWETGMNILALRCTEERHTNTRPAPEGPTS